MLPADQVNVLTRVSGRVEAVNRDLASCWPLYS